MSETFTFPHFDYDSEPRPWQSDHIHFYPNTMYIEIRNSERSDGGYTFTPPNPRADLTFEEFLAESAKLIAAQEKRHG